MPRTLAAMSSEDVLAYLRRFYTFDALTGEFRRASDHSAILPQGALMGSLNRGGYLRKQIQGKTYSVHRLVWLYVNGCWPNAELDHINGTKTDNRIQNLREATNSQNQANKGKSARNRSGYKGVTRHPCGNWQAAITVNKRFHYLGMFKTPLDGHNAYMRAAREHFGDFANNGAQR